MRKNYFYLLFLASFLTVSCKKDSPSGSSLGNVINIEAGITGLSRVPQLDDDGSGTFSKGDVMTLFVQNGVKNVISRDYSYSVDKITWEGLGLTADLSAVTFSACYPKQTIDNDGMFEFNSLSSGDGDLLVAPAQEVKIGTLQPVRLAFVHMLHRLDFVFSPGDGYSVENINALSLSLDAKHTCVVNAAKGKLESVKNETGTYNAGGAHASFYLPPQSTSGVSIRINVAGETEETTLSDLLIKLGNKLDTIESGKCCTIKLKIGSDGITVEGGSIGAWEDQVSADGEIVIG